jgi:hypothetical protein
VLFGESCASRALTALAHLQKLNSWKTNLKSSSAEQSFKNHSDDRISDFSGSGSFALFHTCLTREVFSMLTLAMLAFGLSILWTVLVVFANLSRKMANPTGPWLGGWSLWGCWLVTAGLFLFWMVI